MTTPMHGVHLPWHFRRRRPAVVVAPVPAVLVPPVSIAARDETAAFVSTAGSTASRDEGTTHAALGHALSWAITLFLAVGAFVGVRWMGVALNGVATDSMMPTLVPTDLVLSVSPHVMRPAIGKIVVFEADFAGKHIPPHVHRIVGVNPDGTWQTQGDHATTPDPWSVRPDQVLGVVVWHVPSKIIRSPLLIGILIFLVAVAALWPTGRRDDAEDDDELRVAPTIPAAACPVDPYERSTSAGADTILPAQR